MDQIGALPNAPKLLSDGFIYFSVTKKPDPYTTQENSIVQRIPKAGGVAEDIAVSTVSLQAVAVDSTAYFIHEYDEYNVWIRSVPIGTSQLTPYIEESGANRELKFLGQTESTTFFELSDFADWPFVRVKRYPKTATNGVVVGEHDGSVDTSWMEGPTLHWVMYGEGVPRTEFSATETSSDAEVATYPDLCNGILPHPSMPGRVARCEGASGGVDIVHIDPSGTIQVSGAGLTFTGGKPWLSGTRYCAFNSDALNCWDLSAQVGSTLQVADANFFAVDEEFAYYRLQDSIRRVPLAAAQPM